MATVTELALFHQSLKVLALEKAVRDLKAIAVQEMESCGFGGWYNTCKTASEHADLALNFKPEGEEYSQPF